jgi:erythronate-4-phosphate dehydrogenase
MVLKILADENIPAVEQYLGAAGEVRRAGGRAIGPAQLQGVDALLVRSVTQVDERLLRGSAVRFVGTATSGMEHVDREYLRERGIGFTHAPGSNANAVVEYLLAAIAAVGEHLERLLAGGEVGVVGYGVIGRRVTARLRALGIGCRVYDPWLDRTQLPDPATLPEVLACEVVALHPELTREQPWPSFHLLGRPELAQLDRTALLVNASRGAVVDNAALRSLLGRRGAPDCVLDVWEGEPAIDRDLLAKVTLGTPHIAGYSLDGKLRGSRAICRALASHFGIELPVTAAAAAAPSPVELTAALEGAPLLRHLLAARYDIRQDDARLRRALAGASDAGAAAAFDRLRREYPERRELLGSVVRGHLPGGGATELLRILGCAPVAQEGEP